MSHYEFQGYIYIYIFTIPKNPIQFFGMDFFCRQKNTPQDDQPLTTWHISTESTSPLTGCRWLADEWHLGMKGSRTRHWLHPWDLCILHILCIDVHIDRYICIYIYLNLYIKYMHICQYLCFFIIIHHCASLCVIIYHQALLWLFPIPSMYGIFTYAWLIFMVFM